MGKLHNSGSYDLDTKEGMANAIAWTNRQMAYLALNGVWFIPRSNTYVKLISREPQVVSVMSLMPDESVVRVLNASGWDIQTNVCLSM